MKFVINSLLIMLLSFAACLYLPWWSIAIAAFIVCACIPIKPLFAFLSGFLALFLLWGSLTFFISTKNDHILAHRVSMLVLKSDSPYMLMLMSAFIGALVGGLAALSGSFLGNLLLNNKKRKTI